MHAGEDDDRRAGIDSLDMTQRDPPTEIDLAAPERRKLGGRWDIRIADLCETFRAQQFFGGKQGRDAGVRPPRKADRCRFEGAFGGGRRRSAEEAGGAGQ
jgi:hypothetical protein